jgi:hypothetical protein
MAGYEDDDIDKMFEEIISSDEIKEISSDHIEAIISIEHVSIESILKELIFISESMSQAIVHVNQLMLDFMCIENYKLDEEIRDALGSIYKLTEDLDERMIELVLQDSDLEENEEDDNE